MGACLGVSVLIIKLIAGSPRGALEGCHQLIVLIVKKNILFQFFFINTNLEISQKK